MPTSRPRPSDNTILFGGIGAFLVVLLGIFVVLGIPFMEQDRALMTAVPAPVVAR